MEASKLKNMVVLKNLPSNLVDEAIIILKANKRVKKLEKLLDDDELRISLAKEGAEDAKQFSWEITINKIEKYYQEIAHYVIE